MRGAFTLYHGSQKREALIAGATLLIFSLLLATVLSFQIVRTHRNAVHTGYVRANNLTKALEEQTRRIVQTLDFALADVARDLANDPDTPPHDPSFAERLRQALAQLPFARALFVVGRNGYVIHDSDLGTPNVSLADRDYFKAHLSGDVRGLYVGFPLQSRSTQIGSPWFVSASRSIRRDDGTFYGVAVAAVDPRYFGHFYSELGAAKELAIALVHESGLVIARYPEHTNGVGISLADQKLFTHELERASAGIFSDFSKVDRVERLYAFRKVESLPLIVSVGLNKSALLADWLRQTLVICAAAVGLISVLILGAILILRQRARDLVAAEHLHHVERLESLGQITSTVAHDFNNILILIGGNIEMAMRKLSPDDASQRRLSIALQAVQQGGRMAKDLLTFARHGSAEPKCEDLCQLLVRESELLRQAARPCDINLVVPEQRCEVVMDASGFERAVMNLVVNARHASKIGKLITVSAEIVAVTPADKKRWPGLAPGQYVACRVEDQGEGIPPERLPRVFDPFFTTKPDGLGTGLGLSQVFGFARQSGGGVYIRSQVGTGTTITLMLPLAASGTHRTRSLDLSASQGGTTA